MKLLTIGNKASIPIADDHHWRMSIGTGRLLIDDSAGNQLVELELIKCEFQPSASNKARSRWCYDWLINFLAEEIGPPYQSSIEEIENTSWLGYQSVTSLGDGVFNGNRCIACKNDTTAMHLSFVLARNKDSERILEILEGVSFNV